MALCVALSEVRMVRISARRLLANACLVLVVLLLVYILLPCHKDYIMLANERLRRVYDRYNRTFTYDRYMPLIFIGGVPRSGTTLMRAILDAHPDVRCGEETRVIPRLIGLRNNMLKSKRESERLNEAGIDDAVLDSAMSSFMLEIIARHGEPASRLCNKDPLTLKSTTYLNKLFPNAKFLLMLRDGRAVVHSIISRRITITGFDLKNYGNCLRSWNAVISTMYAECNRVGSSICMPVHYEQLVLHPRNTIRTILKFLDIPWDNAVMAHEQFIGKPGGVSLSKTERSTSQVIKPVNLNALTEWVGKIPDNVIIDMHNIAPMLSLLGYDPNENPPKYGEPDREVADKTVKVRENQNYWRQREADTVHGIGIKVSTDKILPGTDQPVNPPIKPKPRD